MTPRPCAHCGATLTRKRFVGGRLESNHRFKRRQYCGQSCMAAAFAADPQFVAAGERGWAMQRGAA